jgi:hypothetical protein
MIVLEFSDAMVDFHKRAPAKICVIHRPLEQNPRHRRFFEIADRAYVIEGTTAKVIKDRYGELRDFHISREDAVALVLKAAVL